MNVNIFLVSHFHVQCAWLFHELNTFLFQVTMHLLVSPFTAPYMDIYSPQASVSNAILCLVEPQQNIYF